MITSNDDDNNFSKIISNSSYKNLELLHFPITRKGNAFSETNKLGGWCMNKIIMNFAAYYRRVDQTASNTLVTDATNALPVTTPGEIRK